MTPPPHLGPESLVVLALTGAAVGDVDTRVDELGLAPRLVRLLGSPLPVAAGGASLRLTLPDDLDACAGLCVQGLFLAPRAGAGRRLVLTNALPLSAPEADEGR